MCRWSTAFTPTNLALGTNLVCTEQRFGLHAEASFTLNPHARVGCARALPAQAAAAPREDALPMMATDGKRVWQVE